MASTRINSGVRNRESVPYGLVKRLSLRRLMESAQALEENILDEFMFISDGKLTLYNNCDNVRSELGKSLDTLFREVFRC